jgi:protein-disulfide isomerase
MKTNTRVILICLLLSLPFTWYAYQQQKNAEAEAATDTEHSTALTHGNVYERPYSPSFGPDDAKVTIVEYFDPACGACRAFYPVVKEIQSRHPEDVRVVLRYATFHQGSEAIVRMLEAARQQGKFKSTLEALLIAQSEWTINHQVVAEKAWPIAEQAGLDIAKAKADMMSPEIDQRLLQEKADIRELKVSKTPTFFVNEQALTKFGAQELYDLVVSEISKP